MVGDFCKDGVQIIGWASAMIVASWAKMVGGIVSSTLESGSDESMVPVALAVQQG